MVWQMRKIIHIDMDAFYASVEIREQPHLADKPVAIGGPSESRGVIATCNYIARRYGVRSAMSTYKAVQLCPSLVLLPANFALYKQISAQIHQIFCRYTDLIEPLSLDEAYLDVSGCSLFRGSATRIAEAIRADILRETGLTASAGVAPNKFIAKIASDENKPDGICVVTPAEVDQFVARLPLRKIPGVGPATEQRLAQIGLHSAADVRFANDAQLASLGRFGRALRQRCLGIDEREVIVSRERKSVGVEHTYPSDLQNLDACQAKLPALLAELEQRLQRSGKARAVSKFGLKLKFADFQQTTVEQRCTRPSTALAGSLLERAFERGQGRAIRLIGLFVGVDAGAEEIALQQIPLF